MFKDWLAYLEALHQNSRIFRIVFNLTCIAAVISYLYFQISQDIRQDNVRGNIVSSTRAQFPTLKRYFKIEDCMQSGGDPSQIAFCHHQIMKLAATENNTADAFRYLNAYADELAQSGVADD